MIKSILLAEDNKEHCFFFKKALNEIAPDIQFTDVHDGDALISFLENFIPDLLFLDLNMPCKNGMECIKSIRENRIYDSLPIIIFSIAHDDNVIQLTYSLGAHLYFLKPAEYSTLVSGLRSILSMDWNNPKSITEKHLQGGRYVSFQYEHG
jgi:DNA-binding response OmpR family regulator